MSDTKGALSEAADRSIEVIDGDNNNSVKSLKRKLRVSGSNISEGMSTNTLSISKVNALKFSVDKHNDAIAKILLDSRESIDKKRLLNRLLGYARMLLSRYPLL